MLNVIAGFLIISNEKGRNSSLIRIMGTLTLVSQLLMLFKINTHVPMSLFYLLYFISISVFVYKEIYRNRKVNVELLTAVICGLIILGFITSFLILTVNTLIPGSFSGIHENDSFEKIVYFSFITILSIGYGDITPVTELARSIVILIGLAGNIYNVMVTGITVGKFLSQKKS